MRCRRIPRPTISDIADVKVTENAGQISRDFTVQDQETSSSLLTVVASSSNQNVVRDSSIVIDGTGEDRTIRVTPVSDVTGTAEIEVEVTDPEGLRSTRRFRVTVSANELPTISAIGPVTLQVNDVFTTTFTVDDQETPAAALNVQARSSNQNLIPDSRLLLSGDNGNWVLQISGSPESTGNFRGHCIGNG